MLACTLKPRPRYLVIVLAFAGNPQSPGYCPWQWARSPPPLLLPRAEVALEVVLRELVVRVPVFEDVLPVEALPFVVVLPVEARLEVVPVFLAAPSVASSVSWLLPLS